MSDTGPFAPLLGAIDPGIQAVPDRPYHTVVNEAEGPIAFGYPVPYPVSATLAVSGRVILLGYSIKESTGAAAAEWDLFSGTDNRGLLAIPLTLTAGQSAEDWFGMQGLWFPGGIFPQVTTGAITGSMWISLPGG